MPQMPEEAKKLLANATLLHTDANATSYFANDTFIMLEIPNTEVERVKEAFRVLGKVCPLPTQSDNNVRLNFSNPPFYFVEIADFFPAAKQELIGKACQYARNHLSIQPQPNSDQYNFTFHDEREKQAFINSMGLLGIDLRQNAQNYSTIIVSDKQLKDIGDKLGIKKENMLDSDKQLLAKVRVAEVPQDEDSLYFEKGNFILEIPHAAKADVEAALKKAGFGVLPIIEQKDDKVTINIVASNFAAKADYFPQVKSQLSTQAGEYCKRKLKDLSALTQNSCSLSFESDDKKQAFINNMRIRGLDLRTVSLKSTDPLSIILTDVQLKAIDENLGNPPRDMKNFHKQLNQTRLVESLTGCVFQSGVIDRNDEPFIELQLNTDKIKADELENFVIYLKEVIGLKSACTNKSGQNDIVLIDSADYHKLSNIDNNTDFLPRNELASPEFSTLCRHLKHPDNFKEKNSDNPNDQSKNLVKSAQKSLQDIINSNYNFYKDGEKDLVGVKLTSPSHAQYFRDVLHLEDNTTGKILYLTQAEFNRVFDDSNAFTSKRAEFLLARSKGLEPLKKAIDGQNLWSSGSHFSLIINNDKVIEELLFAARLAGAELKIDGYNPHLVNISNSDYEKLAPFIKRGLPKAKDLHAHYRVIDQVISASSKQGQKCLPLKNLFETILVNQNYPEGLDATATNIIITSQHANFAAIKQACELSFPEKNFDGDNITLTEMQINHFLANPQNRPENNIKNYADLQSESNKNQLKLPNENDKQTFFADFKNNIQNKVGLSSYDKDHFLLTFNSVDEKNKFVQDINKFGQKIDFEDYVFDPSAVIFSNQSLKSIHQIMRIAPVDMKMLHKQLLIDRLNGSIDIAVKELPATEPNQPVQFELSLKGNTDAAQFAEYLQSTIGLKNAFAIDGGSIKLDEADFIKLMMLDKDPHFNGTEVDEVLISFCKGLKDSVFEPTKARLKAKIFERDNFTEYCHFYKRDNDIIVGIECKSVEEANYFRMVLDINDSQKGNMLYLDANKFAILADVSSKEFQKKFIAHRNAGLEPLKKSIENDQLRNEKSGFSLTIDDDPQRKGLIVAAKKCGVILTTEGNKLLISDTQYALLAAPFAKEYFGYLPPDAKQAHYNCDANDLCRRINFTAGAKSIKISGATVLQLQLKKGSDKEETAKFLKKKFGLTSAAAAKSDDAIQLSQHDYQELLALPNTRHFKNHKKLEDALKPLQVISLTKPKKPAPPTSTNTTKPKESTSFKENGKTKGSKKVDEKADIQRMKKLDEWIARAPDERKKDATRGNPSVVTVLVVNTKASDKSGQFIYDTTSGVITAEGDNRKPEIFSAMLEVLGLEDPVIDVVVKSSVNATEQELIASFEAAANAFIVAIGKGLVPIVDESSPFTQSKILGKLSKEENDEYRKLKNALSDPKLKTEIEVAEKRKELSLAKKGIPESGNGSALNDDKDSRLSSDNNGSSNNFQ